MAETPSFIASLNVSNISNPPQHVQGTAASSSSVRDILQQIKANEAATKSPSNSSVNSSQSYSDSFASSSTSSKSSKSSSTSSPRPTASTTTPTKTESTPSSLLPTSTPTKTNSTAHTSQPSHSRRSSSSSASPSRSPSSQGPRHDSGSSSGKENSPASKPVSKSSVSYISTADTTFLAPPQAQLTDVAELQALVERQKQEIAELKEESYLWSKKAQESQKAVPKAASTGNGSRGQGQDQGTAKEIQALQKEIAQQEIIIEAYQKDNEKLTVEIKDVRTQLQEAKSAVHDVRRVPIDDDGPAQKLAEIRPQYQQMQARCEFLELELKTREEEWRLEFDKLKRQKKDIEGKYAGVDWEKISKDDLEIRALKIQIQRMEADHATEIKDLNTQINWYIDNQDLLTKNDDLLSQQAQTIDNLRQRVLELENLQTSDGNKEKLATRHRERVFQKRIAELEQLLAKGKKVDQPVDDSIPALIRAVKPSESESQAYKAMQRKVQTLQAEVDDQTSRSEKALRVLRQESDKMKSCYEKRIHDMEEDFKLRLKAATTKKIGDLSRQLEESRVYYSKKVRLLEQQCSALKREQRQSTKSIGPPSRAHTPLLKKGDTSPIPSDGGDHHTMVGVDQEVQTLPLEDQEARANEWKAQAHKWREEADRLAAQNRRLKSRIKAFTDNSVPNSDSGMWATPTATPTQTQALNQAGPDLSLQIQRLQNKLAAAVAESATQKAMAANVQQTLTKVQTDNNERIAQLVAEQRHVTEELRQQHMQEMAALTSQWKEQMERVNSARLIGPWQGEEPHNRVGYLQSVVARMEALEHHCALRERELERNLKETKRVADFELSVERQKMQLLIQAKNHEIERFQMDLDSLLAQIHNITQAHEGQHS